MQHQFQQFERDQWLDRVPLRPSAKLVLARIARYPECYESQETMRSACGFRCKRTIQRVLSELEDLDLITTHRRWNDRARSVVNHHRVNWESVRRLVGVGVTKATPAPPDQSDIESRPKRHSLPTKATLNPDQSDIESRSISKDTKELTNNEHVVGLVFSFGVLKARVAVNTALQMGLSLNDILERCDKWQQAAHHSPGVLFNWLTLRGSYDRAIAERTRPQASEHAAPIRPKRDKELTRYQIHRDGRRMGLTLDEIDARCTAAGV